MKHLLCIILFLVGFCFSGKAQYAKIKVGATLGYQKLTAKKWNELFSAYNLAAPETAAAQPNFNGGFSYGIYGGYTLFNGITLVPELHFASFKSSASDDTYSLDLKAKFMDISLHGDFYFWKFLNWAKGIHPEDAPDRFFTRATLTYSKFSFSAAGAPKSGNDVSAVSGAGGAFRFGLGLGYHFYVTDQISITPVLNLSFGSGTAQGLSEAILPAGSTGGSDKSGLFRKGLEFKVAYTIKPLKPLCPIADCRVAQEHRHSSLFGDVIVRGNPYTLRQNPRYGQKHRGGDRKKLTKKLERKAARQKAKEEKAKREAAEKAKEAQQAASETEETTENGADALLEDPAKNGPETDDDPPGDDPDNGGK